MTDRDQLLMAAYWKLREHASTYRSTHGFRRSYEAWHG